MATFYEDFTPLVHKCVLSLIIRWYYTLITLCILYCQYICSYTYINCSVGVYKFAIWGHFMGHKINTNGQGVNLQSGLLKMIG